MEFHPSTGFPQAEGADPGPWNPVCGLSIITAAFLPVLRVTRERRSDWECDLELEGSAEGLSFHLS